MKQRLIIATIGLFAVFLVGGIYFPGSPLMWLASEGQQFTIIRASIIMILISLLFYRPPRSVVSRMGLVVVAAGLGVATVSLMNSYMIQLFDALLFFEVTILLFIEAAEIDIEKAVAPEAEKRRKIPVRRRIKVIHAN